MSISHIPQIPRLNGLGHEFKIELWGIFLKSPFSDGKILAELEFRMNENLSWSASAGRWMGVPVRLHVSLFLFVTCIFGVQAMRPAVGDGTAIVTTLCLLLAILLHEFAHLFALSNLGGHVNSIVFTPWGGNSDFSLPPNPKSQLAVSLAGPFFSGCLFALGAALLLQTNQATLSELVNPFRPSQFDAANWEVNLMKIMTWLNFQLMVVNLIPCFPFDGSNMIRSVIDGLSSEVPMERRESTILVIGHAVGLTLIGIAWFIGDYVDSPVTSGLAVVPVERNHADVRGPIFVFPSNGWR